MYTVISDEDTMKMLMSKLERESLGKAVLVLHANV